MKITINGIYEGYPVTLEADAIPQQLSGIIQDMLDVGITPPESLSEFVKSVEVQAGKAGNRPLPTDHQPPTNETNNVSAPLCPVHRAEMRAGNKGGYYCSRKNADGTWCDERITQKKPAHVGSQPKQQNFITPLPVNEHGF